MKAETNRKRGLSRKQHIAAGQRLLGENKLEEADGNVENFQPRLERVTKE